MEVFLPVVRPLLLTFLFIIVGWCVRSFAHGIFDSFYLNISLFSFVQLLNIAAEFEGKPTPLLFTLALIVTFLFVMLEVMSYRFQKEMVTERIRKVLERHLRSNVELPPELLDRWSNAGAAVIGVDFLPESGDFLHRMGLQAGTHRSRREDFCRLLPPQFFAAIEDPDELLVAPQDRKVQWRFFVIWSLGALLLLVLATIALALTVK